MKRLVLLFISAYFFVGCKSEEEKLKEQMTPVLTKILLRDSTVVKLDSLIVFDIDTVSDKVYQLRRADIIANYIPYLEAVAENHLQMGKLHASSLKSSYQQASLYEYLSSSVLSRIEKENAEEYRDKMNEEFKKAQLYADSITYYIGIIKKIKSDVKTEKLDSTNFIGYKPWVRVVGSDKDGVQVRKDSLFIFLSKEMSVIPVKAHE